MVKHRLQPFDYLNISAMLILMAVFILPFLYVLNISVSDSFSLVKGFSIIPSGFNLDSYLLVFKNHMIWSGYANSILYSTAGTILTLFVCSLPAYVLTAKEFKPKKSFTLFFAITMFFNGGIIPAFLVIRNLGMLDSIWAIIVPSSISAWNIILFRTNFKEIPDSLIESAKIDGAGHFWIYLKIVVALSKPIFAVLFIFSFIALWNSYFPALLYLTSQDKQPLMIVLRKYVIDGNMRGPFEILITTVGKPVNMIGFERSIKMATIMVSVLPIVLLYPFMQKFLAKGIMIGALKG